MKLFHEGKLREVGISKNGTCAHPHCPLNATHINQLTFGALVAYCQTHSDYWCERNENKVVATI